MQVEFTKPYYKDINKRLGEGVRGRVVSKLIRFSTGMGTTNFKQPASGYQEHIYEQKIQMQVRARERERAREGGRMERLYLLFFVVVLKARPPHTRLVL